MQQLRRIRLIALSLFALSACGSDDEPRSRDAGEDAQTQDSSPIEESDASVLDPGPVVDASGIDAAIDASQCVPLGCQELGHECGETIDNCGQPLNCNKADGTSTCEAPLRCGGDPAKGANKCGCAPRANACEAQGAQCGVVDECGTPVDCGGCANGAVCLNNTCACTPNLNPCGDKVCGMADDGCGKMVACGANNGACAQGTCGTTGQCACRPRAEACAGKTGAVTENGCTYNCDSTCVPNNAAACAGAECGTATNNCGEVVNCGSSAGQCGAGNSCVAGTYITGNALPARTAQYKGGYCVPTNASKLLGKYITRAHAFRQGGTATINIINRAESVAYVTVTYNRSTQKTHLREIPCVATTRSPKGGLEIEAIVPYYRNLLPAEVDLVVSGSNWSRPEPTNAQGGKGSPNGFTKGMPAFCVGKAGQTVDLPAGDPRRGTFWPDNKCTCPASDAAANALPADTFSTMVSRDCRLVDSDGDKKPGFSAWGYSPFPPIENIIYNVNISHPLWSGVIRDDRYHVGTIAEGVETLERSVVGCRNSNNPLCKAPDTDCGCDEKSQTVQWVPLDDSDPLSCDTFYNLDLTPESPKATPLGLVKQKDIDSTFAKSYGTCTAAGQCPTGSICRLGKCIPWSSQGACTYRSSMSGACPGNASSFCEACPSGMECKSDDACWPTASACKAPPKGERIGQLCSNPM